MHKAIFNSATILSHTKEKRVSWYGGICYHFPSILCIILFIQFIYKKVQPTSPTDGCRKHAIARRYIQIDQVKSSTHDFNIAANAAHPLSIEGERMQILRIYLSHMGHVASFAGIRHKNSQSPTTITLTLIF